MPGVPRRGFRQRGFRCAVTAGIGCARDPCFANGLAPPGSAAASEDVDRPGGTREYSGIVRPDFSPSYVAAQGSRARRAPLAFGKSATGATRHVFRRDTPFRRSRSGADSGSAVASPSELSRRASCPRSHAPRPPRQDLSERLRPPPISRGVQGSSRKPPIRQGVQDSSRTPPIRQSHAICGGPAHPNHNWRESGQKRA
jgi:hypothetical protein